VLREGRVRVKVVMDVESEVLGVVELGIGNFERKVEFSIMISRITKHTSPTRLIIKLAI
jgi:hypothetical protein